MMDLRSWPWKKKSSDKLSATPDSTDSYQGCGTKVDDERESEETIKFLKEQLSDALSDLGAKEDLVKQHAKVAEEAVTGWEKADADAVGLRQKLDAALQQKLATEDRVLHLDGALKECMRQLRYVREEQEQRVHDAVMKKTREWEKTRTELDANLADVVSQLVEVRAESDAMSQSLQERARTIVAVSEAKALADSEVKMLQVRLCAVEKENTKLKYEIHVLSKELEIRNEEREYNKKIGDAANKQHLENVKKIAKLETECQRLRLLVRKRLPGPAALAQMRLEVEVLGKENGERRRSCRRNATCHALPVDYMDDILHDNGERNFEGHSSSLVAVEEQSKVLKEVLGKQNNEFQAARLMCAGAASKLSTVEEQLDGLSCTLGLPKSTCTMMEGSVEPLHRLGSSKEVSLASMSQDGAPEDGVISAESWASALMAELAQFKKEKKGQTADKTLTSSTLDLLDDFAEMEKLASLSSPQTVIENQTMSTFSCGTKAEELESDGQLLQELRSKLVHAEEQVSAMHERDSRNMATIACLKQHLSDISKAQVEGTDSSKLMKEVKDMLDQMEAQCESKQVVFNSPEGLTRLCLNGLSDPKGAFPCSPSCQSQESILKEVTVIPNAMELRGSSIGPELVDAVHKVVVLVEGLAQSDFTVSFPHLPAENATGFESVSENSENTGTSDPFKEWRNLEFDASLQSLITLCQSLSKGKVDIIDFMAEVASVLDWLVGYISSSSNQSVSKTCTRRQLDWNKGSPANSDSDVAITTNIPVSEPDKINDLDKESAKLSLAVTPDHDCVSDAHIEAALQNEIQTLLSEKKSLQSRLVAEITNSASLQCALSQMTLERDEIVQKYKLAGEQLEDLKSQLERSEHQLADIKSQLTTALEKKEFMQSSYAGILHVKELVESELRDAKNDLKQLQKNAAVLQEELLEQINSRKDVETKLAEKEQQLIRKSQLTVRTDESRSSSVPADEASRVQKELEIAAAAEKLAECQQTILMLGKQLNALGAPKDLVETSFCSSSESMLIHQTCSLLDQMHYAHKSSDGLCHIAMEGPKANPGLGRNEGDKRPEHGSTLGHRISHHSGSIEADSGHRGQINNRHWSAAGREIPADLYRGNGFLSPVHGDNLEGPGCIPFSPSEQIMSSPGRSPARFLSLKNRNSGGHTSSKHGDSVSTSEKHGTAFSRFFLRTRSGH